MSDDMLAEYESHNEHSVEPFSEYGALILQSGVPVRVKDSGGQGNWARVPEPQAGEEGEVLTVQPDLSIAWSPSTGGGGFNTTTVTLTNAEVKSTTVVPLVAAQGAGTIIWPIRTTARLNYGGTDAFTNNPGFQYTWNGTAPTAGASAGSTAFLSTAASCYLISDPVAMRTNTTAAVENEALGVRMTLAATGNAANDNTVTIATDWIVIPVP